MIKPTAISDKPVLITGGAGFIGMHLAKRYLEDGAQVIAVDNLNDYYDVTLKMKRLEYLNKYPKFRFQLLDLVDHEALHKLFQAEKFDNVIHLAAQAGVRHSIEAPREYLNANYVGFFNLIEEIRYHGVQHFVYASSSSVYGLNKEIPFSIKGHVAHPASLYAASKRANELMAHSYAHLYNIPCTGLRFFTVYGPWGRPDMAAFLFCKAIMADKPIKVFNYGNMRRDFTYIDDIIEGVVRVLERPPVPDQVKKEQNNHPNESSAPYRIYNIGAGKPVDLMDFVGLIEKELNKKAIIEKYPMQMGDVYQTYADVSELVEDTGYHPVTQAEEGIAKFVEWYLKNYN